MLSIDSVSHPGLYGWLQLLILTVVFIDAWRESRKVWPALGWAAACALLPPILVVYAILKLQRWRSHSMR